MDLQNGQMSTDQPDDYMSIDLPNDYMINWAWIISNEHWSAGWLYEHWSAGWCNEHASAGRLNDRQVHETRMIRMIEAYHPGCQGYHPNDQDDSPKMQKTRRKIEKTHPRGRPLWTIWFIRCILKLFNLCCIDYWMYSYYMWRCQFIQLCCKLLKLFDLR